MNRKDAARVLGVSDSASQEAIHLAYRRLAKRTHPDAPGGTHERFERVQEAYRSLRFMTDPSPLSFKQVRAELRNLDRALGPETDKTKIDEQFAQLVQTSAYKDQERAEALMAARDLRQKRNDETARLQARSLKRGREHALHASYSDEERDIMRLQARADELTLQKGLRAIPHNIAVRARRIAGRLHLPIWVRGKEQRSHRRWIPLTAALLGAIGLGYYAWHRSRGAYTRALVKT